MTHISLGVDFVMTKYGFKYELKQDLVPYINPTKPMFFTFQLTNTTLSCIKVESDKVLDNDGFPIKVGIVSCYHQWDKPLSKGEYKSDRIYQSRFELNNLESLADALLELVKDTVKTKKVFLVKDNLFQMDSETNGDLMEQVIETALKYQSSFKFKYNNDILIVNRNLYSYSPNIDLVEYSSSDCYSQIDLRNVSNNTMDTFYSISELVDYIQNNYLQYE